MGQSTPIKIDGHAYDPETIDVLRRVLDDVWAQMNELQRNRLPRSRLAERLLLAAAGGERNAATLRLCALAELRAANPRSDARQRTAS